MDKAAPSMFKATLIGGASAGIAGSVPYVGALNCACCSLVIGGGFLAAFLYSRDCLRAGVEFRPGSGALVGLVAGLFYAVFNTLGQAVGRLIGPEGAEQAIQDAIESLEEQQNVPPETIDLVESVMRLFTSWAGLFFLFCIILLIAAVFSTLGGLIGGATFKVEPRPDAGGPPGPIEA